MTAANAGAYDEIWKERLTFTSGSILIWGYSLIQLWPYAAGLKASRRIHFWTLISEFFREGSIRPEDQTFFLIVLLLTLGFWTVLFAALHVLARGLWLTHDHDGEEEDEQSKKLATLSEFTFRFVFLLNAYSIPLAIFASLAYVADAMVSYMVASIFHFRAPSWLGSLFVGAILGLLIVFKDRPKIANLIRSLKPLIPRIRINMAYAGFFWLFIISMFAMIEMTYTIDLTIDKKVASKSQDKVVRVSVRLGGSASSAPEANLAVIGPQEQLIQKLPLDDLGDGNYTAGVSLEGLPNGVYQIRLDYPHISLARSTSIVHNQTQKTERFLVTD